jgi:multicomponent Na+:H+ antiporter subunit A
MAGMAEAEGSHAAGSAPRGGILRLLPAVLSGLAFWWFLGFVHTVSEIGPAGFNVPWVPSLGASFSFRLDGLALVFALLVTGIGTLILLYASEYFRHHPARNRLLLILVLFEISMLGLVVSDDILTLFLFWEGTTITSWLLIGFDHEKADARAKAAQALIVTGLGGVALLAGLLMLGAEAGTYRLSAIAQAGEAIRASELYGGIFLLVIIGCFTKSAQIPFHYWLPNAMAAPTPVSAYLHSATMVKAGVFLLARLAPGLGGTDLWLWTLTGFGAATMLLSSIWSLRQTDLKLGLAYTTVMGLGTLTMFLGVGGEGAIIGFCVFLIVHAFYKACLFLVIGIIDKQAGTREVARLGGLGTAMPLTFAIAALGAAAMAGFPPFFGFIGKEAMYEGALHGEAVAGLVVVAAILANAMMIGIAGAVGLKPFRGERKAAKAEPRDPSIFMWIGPGVLAVLGLLFGLAPGLVDHALIAPMAQSVAGHPIETHLSLWHGLNMPLLLSLITFGLGFLLFQRLDRVRSRLIETEEQGLARALARAQLPLISAISRQVARIMGTGRIARFEDSYDAVLATIEAVGAGSSRLLQSGIATRYLQATFAVMAAMVLGALALAGWVPHITWEAPPQLFVLAAILMALASLVLPFTQRRLLQITSLGVVGVGVALVFALFGAIDVAITQLMVETLVVVIVAVALLKLPRIVIQHNPAARRFRALNAAIAGALGAGFAAALGVATRGELDRSVTVFYEQASATVALGRNIVNVILVDFRALDTMGEIAVIAVAGLAALALLANGSATRISPRPIPADEPKEEVEA